MPDSDQNLQEEPASRNKDAWRPPPSIRTMKTDIQELFQKTKPSFIQIVGQEVAARAGKEKKNEPRWIKSVIIVGLVGALTAAGAWGISLWLRNPPPEPSEAVNKGSSPQLFPSDQTLEIKAATSGRIRFNQEIETAVRRGGRDGTITRLSITLEDGPQTRPATLEDFFDLYRIRPPQNFLSNAERLFMAFVYHGGEEGHLGLASRVRDADRTLLGLLSWEQKMLADLRPLFFAKKLETQGDYFEDRTYRNIDWRFLKLSDGGGAGIAYAVFPAHKVFVLATSREALEKAIDRLFEMR